ncbi:hypothetical protein C8R43DRAFT_1202262 [Mycena crocata]|nr:hypothetical protein C8R43DRAFT_1202262 [Mycena crocata]
MKPTNPSRQMLSEPPYNALLATAGGTFPAGGLARDDFAAAACPVYMRIEEHCFVCAKEDDLAILNLLRLNIPTLTAVFFQIPPTHACAAAAPGRDHGRRGLRAGWLPPGARVVGVGGDGSSCGVRGMVRIWAAAARLATEDAHVPARKARIPTRRYWRGAHATARTIRSRVLGVSGCGGGRGRGGRMAGCIRAATILFAVEREGSACGGGGGCPDAYDADEDEEDRTTKYIWTNRNPRPASAALAPTVCCPPARLLATRAALPHPLTALPHPLTALPLGPLSPAKMRTCRAMTHLPLAARPPNLGPPAALLPLLLACRIVYSQSGFRSNKGLGKDCEGQVRKGVGVWRRGWGRVVGGNGRAATRLHTLLTVLPIIRAGDMHDSRACWVLVVTSGMVLEDDLDVEDGCAFFFRWCFRSALCRALAWLRISAARRRSSHIHYACSLSLFRSDTDRLSQRRVKAEGNKHMPALSMEVSGAWREGGMEGLRIGEGEERETLLHRVLVELPHPLHLFLFTSPTHSPPHPPPNRRQLAWVGAHDFALRYVRERGMKADGGRGMLSPIVLFLSHPRRILLLLSTPNPARTAHMAQLNAKAASSPMPSSNAGNEDTTGQKMERTKTRVVHPRMARRLAAQHGGGGGDAVGGVLFSRGRIHSPPSQNPRGAVHSSLTDEALLLCSFRESKIAVVSSTAAASCDAAPQRGHDDLGPSARAAFSVFEDLLLLTNSEKPQLPQARVPPQDLCAQADRECSITTIYFPTELALLLQLHICPLLLKVLSDRPPRVVFLLKQFARELESETEIFLTLLNEIVGDDHAEQAKQALRPQWMRIIAMEIIRRLCSDAELHSGSNVFTAFTALKRLVTEKPALLGRDVHPDGNNASNSGYGLDVAETAGIVATAASATVSGVNALTSSTKAGAPPISEAYIYLLAMQCITSLCEGFAAFTDLLYSTIRMTLNRALVRRMRHHLERVARCPRCPLLYHCDQPPPTIYIFIKVLASCQAMTNVAGRDAVSTSLVPTRVIWCRGTGAAFCRVFFGEFGLLGGPRSPPGFSERNFACLKVLVASALSLAGSLGENRFGILEALQNAGYVLTSKAWRALR